MKVKAIKSTMTTIKESLPPQKVKNKKTLTNPRSLLEHKYHKLN